MIRRFTTKILSIAESTELFDWLHTNRSIVISVDHSPLDLIAPFSDLQTYYGGEDGPWVVVFRDCDDVVFFMLRWC